MSNLNLFPGYAFLLNNYYEAKGNRKQKIEYQKTKSLKKSTKPKSLDKKSTMEKNLRVNNSLCESRNYSKTPV